MSTTTRIDLPGEAWAEVIDAESLTYKERKPLQRAFQRYAMKSSAAPAKPGAEVVTTPVAPQLGGGSVAPTDADIDTQLDLMEGFELESIAFFVASWSLETPVSPDAVADLPIAVFEALDSVVGDRLPVLFPQLRAKQPGGPRGPYDPLTALTLACQGVDVVLPEWAQETGSLLDLVELTHWTPDVIDAQPAHLLERLLMVARARRRAQSEPTEEVIASGVRAAKG